VSGIEVRPSRAREAFWRWEQVLARWTRDILAKGGLCPEGLAKLDYEADPSFFFLLLCTRYIKGDVKEMVEWLIAS
jgi:hypothetical protein